jgi:hypothetical protein
VSSQRYLLEEVIKWCQSLPSGEYRLSVFRDSVTIEPVAPLSIEQRIQRALDNSDPINTLDLVDLLETIVSSNLDPEKRDMYMLSALLYYIRNEKVQTIIDENFGTQ